MKRDLINLNSMRSSRESIFVAERMVITLLRYRGRKTRNAVKCRETTGPGPKALHTTFALLSQTSDCDLFDSNKTCIVKFISIQTMKIKQHNE